MVALDATNVKTEDDLEESTDGLSVESQTQGETGTDAEPAMDAESVAEDEDQQPAESGLAAETAPVVVENSDVTPEAREFFETRKAQLEGEIAELAVEQTRLKASLKANRENLAETTAEYEKHVSRGPEVHPLLDRAPQPAEAATDETGNGEPVMPPDAVSSLRIHLLKTIELEGVTYGTTGTVVQAYQDKSGDVFLVHWPDEETCETAYLEAEEFELVEEEDDPGKPGPVTAPEVTGKLADDSWRSDKIAMVLAGTGKDRLTDKLVEILEGHDIVTMGDLADAPTVKGCELTQLKGITEKRLEKIEAATERYWAERKAAGKAAG